MNLDSQSSNSTKRSSSNEIMIYLVLRFSVIVFKCVIRSYA